MRKIVLLPDPFGPSRPTISPCSMANETSVTARRGPYHLVTCWASTIGDIGSHPPEDSGNRVGGAGRTQSRALRPGFEPAHGAPLPGSITHRIRANACAPCTRL